MNKEDLREFCINLKDVTEHFPFDDVSLVFKVKDKMFALLPLDTVETSISLKCDPDKAVELREFYKEIQPAYHFNKKHWNTVYTEGSLSRSMIEGLIKHSYDLVMVKLLKRLRE